MQSTAGAHGVITEDRSSEYEFTDGHFDYVRNIVTEQTGIRLPDGKRQMVYGRLVRRLRELRLADFDAYVDYLENHRDAELVNLINAITTNLTSFFRENHHFQMIRDRLLPEIIARNGNRRRLRIWSAGCSTGEEPYSIAMTLLDSLPSPSTWDLRILATDIDTGVLESAKKGVYAFDRVKSLPDSVRRRWFLRGRGDNAERVKVRPDLQELIRFKQLNLMGAWPMRGPFDIIFCRNVVIYFDKPTQKRLFERYADVLCEGGYLILGHSESMHNSGDRFQLLGNTVYRKVG
jgi:chemotaxis protein methyltransferase CheR